MYNIPNEIIEIARNLRKNMTFSEKILWDKIRGGKLGKKFLRQHPIYVFSEDSGLHRFIISDFYCKELNLIIEIDGEIHNIYEVSLLDREKEKILISGGYKILRFTNNEVDNCISSVIKTISLFH